jgi:peptide/nickel transport system substrate-binding protein
VAAHGRRDLAHEPAARRPFHDGSPFTADDAKFSIDRIIGASRQVFIVFDQWNFVKEVVKVDDHTIDIVTRAPDPAFLSRLSGTGCGVVSKAYVEANGMEHLSNNAMGTGPFIVTDYDRTSYVRMVANDDYWGGRPEIDELIFRAIPESSTRVAELLTGGVDLALSVAPQDWARIEANANLEMLHYTTDRVWGLTSRRAGRRPGRHRHLDPRGPRGDQPRHRPRRAQRPGRRLRRAHAHPPDPADPVLGPGVARALRREPLRPRARQGAARLGRLPERPRRRLTLHSAQGQGVAHRDIAETVAAMLEDVGFLIDLDIRDLTNFRETVYQNNPGGIMLQTLGNFTTDPWLFVLNYDSKFGTRSMPRNRFGDERLDLTAVLIENQMDPARRCELVAEYAQRVREVNASVELLHQPESLGIRSDVAWTPPTDGKFMMLNVRYR